MNLIYIIWNTRKKCEKQRSFPFGRFLNFQKLGFRIYICIILWHSSFEYHFSSNKYDNVINMISLTHMFDKTWIFQSFVFKMFILIIFWSMNYVRNSFALYICVCVCVFRFDGKCEKKIILFPSFVAANL